MKAKWLICAAAATAMLAVPAFSQVSVYIGRTPPPLRYERRPPPPGEGYAWVDGYWGARDGQYVWVPGRWDRPPYPGAYWSHPHYDHYQKDGAFTKDTGTMTIMAITTTIIMTTITTMTHTKTD